MRTETVQPQLSQRIRDKCIRIEIKKHTPEEEVEVKTGGKGGRNGG